MTWTWAQDSDLDQMTCQHPWLVVKVSENFSLRTLGDTKLGITALEQTLVQTLLGKLLALQVKWITQYFSHLCTVIGFSIIRQVSATPNAWSEFDLIVPALAQMGPL